MPIDGGRKISTFWSSKSTLWLAISFGNVRRCWCHYRNETWLYFANRVLRYRSTWREFRKSKLIYLIQHKDRRNNYKAKSRTCWWLQSKDEIIRRSQWVWERDDAQGERDTDSRSGRRRSWLRKGDWFRYRSCLRQK